MEIEKRIRRLEWTNRALLASVLIVVVGAATGYVKAATSPEKVIANSVTTQSLSVVNPYGKQGFYVKVDKSGRVSAELRDANGKTTLRLLSTVSGEPSICLSDSHTCRVVIGSVIRAGQRELSIQLRNKNGHMIWMPGVNNPYEKEH